MLLEDPKDGNLVPKKDFSCGDRTFAYNIGVDFKTPEEFFDGEKPVSFNWDGMDPEEFLASLSKDLKNYNSKDLVSKDQELILFVGRPASGKSTFARKHFVPAGYVHVNQDTLKTKERCIKAAREAMESGKSVVVDNTNPSASTRREYTSIAEEKGISYRCFYFETNEDLAYHLNYFREKIQNVRRIPDVGYNQFRSKFEEPTMKEGFDEVKKIQFVPDFQSNDHKSLFLQRTC